MKKLTDSNGLITLKGQRSCMLPAKEGINNIHIKVIKGKLRMNHCSYNPDGGTWLSPPNGGRQAHYNLNQGDDLCITVDVRKSYKKLDRIQIVNPSFCQKATFMAYVNMRH